MQDPGGDLEGGARRWFRSAYLLARVYWFARRPETEGVCIALWCGGEVLLVKNSYKHCFTLPGGGRHRGEPWAETGARELLEETGIQVDARALREALETVSTDEYKHDRVRIFELDVETPPAVHVDRREVEWGAFLDAGAALRLPLSPVVRLYLENAARQRKLVP